MFVKLENVASRLVNKRLKKQLTEKLSYDKESNGKVISSEPTCTSSWFCFLSSSVLFFEQNMLDAEQGIQNYKSAGPDKRRSLSPAERGWTFENTISLELHCKGKTFAENSRCIWFILLSYMSCQ